MTIIDIHAHAISKDPVAYPFSPLGGTQSVWTRERPVDGEQLLDWMDKAEIGRAVVVHASTAYGYDNSYAADVAAAHPDRLCFVGAIDVQAADAAERLAYWVRQRGMAGFRIFAAGLLLSEDSGGWLADPHTYPAWVRAQELGVPVCIQTRFNRLPLLRTLLERFPDVTVILDHFAQPPSDDGPPYAAAREFFALSAYPNLYLKLTESNLRTMQQNKSTIRTFMEATISAFGADRIAWGSNFPQSPGTLVELRDFALQELAFLPDAQKTAIFSRTALRLYPQLNDQR